MEHTGLREIATQDDAFCSRMMEHTFALLTGDGQPGRMTLVEECVRERPGNVEHRLWSFADAAALATFLFHYIVGWLGFK